jgi:hypothetical protein
MQSYQRILDSDEQQNRGGELVCMIAFREREIFGGVNH